MALLAVGSLAGGLGLGAHELIALVGGGGKTTLMFAMADQLPGRVVVTTTTMMGREQTNGLTPHHDPRPSSVAERLSHERVVLVRGTTPDEHPTKASGIDPRAVDEIYEVADHVLVEADGSRRLPFKAPAAHEPVIPSRATTVLCCLGAAALGGPIAEMSHRPEAVARLAGCTTDAKLTPDRAAKVLAHPEGGRRGVGVDARFVVVVNRADLDEAAFDELRDRLARAGVHAVGVASGP